MTGTTAKTKIMIRGLNTIRGPKDPLIVVDNFPYEGDLSNLNPNDVENITILKDAAATSIWGAKAGNGVIVINMKKGKFNQPITAEANVNITVATKPNLFAPSRISTSDEIDVEEFLFNQGYRLSDTSNPNRPVISPVYETLLAQQNGQLSPAQAKARIDALRKQDIRKDFQKYMYQDAVNQQYAFNIRGGSQKVSWLFSTGYDKNIGALDDRFDRINLRWENTYQPLKNLSITSSMYYTLENTKSGKPGYGQVTISSNGRSGLYPYAQLAGPNGEVIPMAKNYREAYIDTAGGGQLLDWKYYPMDDYKHSIKTAKSQDALINLGVRYKILNALNIDVKYQYEKQAGTGRTLYDMQSYYTRDLINYYTNLNETGNKRFPIPKGDILDLSQNNISSQEFRAQLNYDQKWGKGELTAIGGWQISEKKTMENGNRLYGFDPDNYTFLKVDHINSYPTFITGGSVSLGSDDDIEQLLNRFVSMYANAAYTYQEKYTISGSARRDASNLFGVKTNNKWKPLWSGGLSWLLSGEEFYQSETIPFLKLRATFGYSGNVDPSQSGVTTIRYAGTSPYIQAPYSTFNSYYNPDLQWETFSQLNLGVDFRAVHNRITGSIDYYHKKNTNLFSWAPIDYTGGIGSSIVKNAATTKGAGIDVVLNTRNLVGKFQWTSNLNLSFNKDKVVKYYLQDPKASEFVGGANRASAIPGQPIYAISAYKWAGLDPQTGAPQGYLDGKISEDYDAIDYESMYQDLAYKGPAMPRFFGSLGNNFSWKNWSLATRLMYKFGFYFFKSAISYSGLYTAWTTTGDFDRRWRKPGDEKTTTVPAMIYPASSSADDFYANSEVNVVKGDYIRLQYITLSYRPRLPRRLTHSIKGVTLKASATNLGFLWRANNDGIDPEYQNGIPASQTFTLGLNASF